MFNNKERDKMKQKEERKEQPLLNLKVEVDSWKTGKFQRLNWEAMNYIDLVEVFQMNVWPKDTKRSEEIIPLKVAERKAHTFMAKLKAYIIEKTEDDDEDFDWSEWNTYRG